MGFNSTTRSQRPSLRFRAGQSDGVRVGNAWLSAIVFICAWGWGVSAVAEQARAVSNSKLTTAAVNASAADLAPLLGLRGEIRFETQVLEDTTASLTLDRIKPLFDSPLATTAAQGLTVAGFTDSVIWHSFSFTNSSEKAVPFVLVINDSMVESFQLFEERGTQRLTHPPNGLANAPARVMYSRMLAYGLALEAGETVRYFIRSESKSALSYGFSVRSPERHQQLHNQDFSLLMFYVGVIVSLVLYNFFLFMSTRGDWSYLLYCGSMLALCSILLSVNGWGGLFLVDYPWLVHHHIWGLFFLSIVLNVGFANYFLKIKQTSKWLYRFNNGYIVFNAAMFLLSCVILNAWVFQMGLLMAFSMPFVCIASAIVSLNKQDKTSLFYLVAWSGFLAVVLIATSTELGLTKHRVNEDLLLIVAHSLETILMSFALAYRIHVLQNQSNEAATLVLLSEERSKAKSLYFSEMSHELRTPMSGVVGMVELLKHTELDEDQRRYVNVIHSSGQSLISLVNDILDMSKIEAGKIDIEKVAFNLEELISDLGTMFSPLALEKQLFFNTSVEPHTPRELMGDPTRLRQILVNLISNAFKFTSEGEVAIRVHQVENTSGCSFKGETTHDQTTLKFDVIDSGIGIPPAAQKRLFEAFIQAESSTTRRYGGTGLGLSICKQLVELMDGNIGITSEEGVGSMFSFTLNFDLCESETDLARETYLADNRANLILRDKRLLVVDPSERTCAVIREQAEFWGMHVDVVRQCEKGLVLIDDGAQANRPYDIILVERKVSWQDHSLGLEGLAMASVIHKKQLSKPPAIILLSAGYEVLSPQDCAGADIHAQYSKPLSMARLRKALCDALATLDLASGLTSISEKEAGEAKASAEEFHSSLRVLVAEDNKFNQMVIKGLMENFQVQFSLVEDGRQAADTMRASHEDFDLILMDINMPRMNGVTATQQIRRYEAEHELTPVPIVALSGEADEPSQANCLEAGMQGFLLKPYNKDAIIGVLRKFQN